MSETAPGRIVGENRRGLGERKDEDEVEEELERTDPLLTPQMLVGHSRTIIRKAVAPRQDAALRSKLRRVSSRSGHRSAVLTRTAANGVARLAG
jgi:hypothetical protein